MLRRYGEERHPAPTPPRSPARQALLDLAMLRRAHVRTLAAYRQRVRGLTPESTGLLQRSIQSMETLIAEIDQALDRWLETQASIEEQTRVHTMTLLVGIGMRSALLLEAHLPELGRCKRRQIAKLAGLAPLPDQSGKKDAPRHIRGGRAEVRQILYPCAVVAARWNDELKAYHQRKRAEGQPAKKAYIAVSHKLLSYLNAMLREERPAQS